MKKVLLVLFACCTTCHAFFVKAQDYNKEEVQNLALAFFDNGISTYRAEPVGITVDSLFLDGKPKMFLCQNGAQWAVIANEQLVTPIVCHGEGELSLEQLYDSPLWFLLTESMIGLDSIRILGEDANSEYFVDDNGVVPLASSTAMTPLLDKNTLNRWNQQSNNNWTSDLNLSYNKFCPTFYKIPEANNGTYVGCTAVAMGQILWYWKWPAYARIPVSIDVAGITSKEFETHYYDWTKMPGRIYDYTPMEQINNVAGLLRDCGYSGNMIYGKEGSSMTLTNALYAFRNDFQFSAHMKQYSAGAKAFNNIIKSEIAAGRPVMIQATHSTNVKKYGTHTFIIDGYDGQSDEYHLNMGWGNSTETTWYSVSGTNSYNNYRIARRMLYEIIPNSTKQSSMLEYTSAKVVDTSKVSVLGNELSVVNSEPIEQWNIYNIYGILIMSGRSQDIDFEGLPMGIYTVVIQFKSSVKTYNFNKTLQ